MSISGRLALRVGLAACVVVLASSAVVCAGTSGACSGADFSKKFFSSSPPSSPISFAVGDFDEDTHADVLLVGSRLFLLPGNGEGSFGTPTEAAAMGARSVAVADFNNDGHLDAAVATQEPFITVVFGIGNGTFHAGVNYPISGISIAIVAADLNGDGSRDLAIARGTAAVLISS